MTVRQEVLGANPRLADVFNPIAAKLTSDCHAALNERVDIARASCPTTSPSSGSPRTASPADPPSRENDVTVIENVPGDPQLRSRRESSAVRRWKRSALPWRSSRSHCANCRGLRAW
jgi:hypothetical protein